MAHIKCSDNLHSVSTVIAKSLCTLTGDSVMQATNEMMLSLAKYFDTWFNFP